MAAELLYGIKQEAPYSLPDAFNRLWEAAGATPENPRPFVKTMLCRIVSIAGIYRDVQPDGSVSLKLVSLPQDCSDPEKCQERHILETFLKAIGRQRPQLVGYNSANADVPILLHRAIVQGVRGFGFATRPDKPWEGVDYFSTASDFHVDLAQPLGRGYNVPRLHEAASISGIPGKVEVSGDNVWALFMSGKLQAIVDYNEFDAFTTHLLWARMAQVGELLSSEQYAAEQIAVRELALKEIDAGKLHLRRYLEKWDELREIQRKHGVET